MSRGDFRSAAAEARPASAWVLSVVASATLWITEQLPLWIVGVQLASFGLSFATRQAPPAFRRSPVLLNLGMLGVTTVTIRTALAGHPATVSLAVFTALAQGLQLLDARPRRTEFVLVALALFQVILASNLTDSIFFPILVVAFLISATWTLIVHTLVVEAIEAGTPEAAQQAIGRPLIRWTALATLGCLLLAAGIFVTLPRVKSHVLQGGVPGSFAVAGFSNRVRLGQAGPIREDPSVVLRVEDLSGALPDPRQAYFRGLAFDAFDGREWSVTKKRDRPARVAVSGIGRFGIDFPVRAGPGRRVRHRILREPVEAGVLFAAGEVIRVEGPFQTLHRNRNGGLQLPEHADDRIRYTVTSRVAPRERERLVRDHAVPPREAARGGPRPAARYLTLPELDPRVAERARRITAGARSDYEAAERLEQVLRREGRYTTSPPPLGDAETTPVEAFLLGEVEGHCEYFASGMVVWARALGLPARLVNGFAGGVPNRLGGFLELTRADAHAWVEIHFQEAGWVSFDPTPPDLRLRAAQGLPPWARLAQLGSAIELWWFRSVVDYDSADQIGALRGLFQRLRGLGKRDLPSAPPAALANSTPGGETPNGLSIGLAGALAAATFVALAIRTRQRRREAARPLATQLYTRALARLARRGVERRPSESARDFSQRLDGRLPGEASAALRLLTDAHLAARFGGHDGPGCDAATAPRLETARATLEHAVDRMGLGHEPHVVEP